MRILVIEDDLRIRELLQKYFTMADCEIEAVDCGEKALERLVACDPLKQEKMRYDVIILDWLLAEEDGLAVGKRIRELSNIPIIMLSVKCEQEDVVNALDCGMDDYLTKPFSLSELEARTRRLADKSRELVFKSTGIKAWGITLDLKKKAILTDDKQTSLSITEYRILTCLLLRQGEVVRTKDLIKHAFTDNKRVGRYIEGYIANLRKKLPASVEIKTIPGKGYRIQKAQ